MPVKPFHESCGSGHTSGLASPRSASSLGPEQSCPWLQKALLYQPSSEDQRSHRSPEGVYPKEPEPWKPSGGLPQGAGALAALRGSTPRSRSLGSPEGVYPKEPAVPPHWLGRGRRSSGAAPSDPRGAKTAVGQQAPGTRGREPRTLQRRGPSEGTGGATKEGTPHRGRVSQKRGPWVGGAAENGILGPAGSGGGGRHLRSFLSQMGRDWGPGRK